ncbi:MAG TPA: ATP-dependent helicase C-terminal domain-containing protein, partial [Myxococcota bacterium]
DFARFIKLDASAQQIRDRIAFAARVLADVAERELDAPWPIVDDAALVTRVLPELCRGARTVADVAGANWTAGIGALLTWKQRTSLDVDVPARIEVPTGNMIAVDYGAALAGGAPVLAVRLQELFGLTATPTVARGRARVVLHLLSPGYKPVQVTSDLASFWATTYAEVKRELRARYPRHSWPDDPLTAPPTARARKRGT